MTNPEIKALEIKTHNVPIAASISTINYDMCCSQTCRFNETRGKSIICTPSLCRCLLFDFRLDKSTSGHYQRCAPCLDSTKNLEDSNV